MKETMKKSDTEKGFTEFLIEDFKDTSAKLESTDKKIQFIVQIYTALVAAIISASLFFLANQFSKIEDILKNNEAFKTNNIIFPLFFIILLFLIGFAICVYSYNIRGNYTHRIYISRLNFLRRVILEINEVSTDKIENFFYINKIATKVGMGSVLNFFILFTINLYVYALLILLSYYLLNNIRCPYIYILFSTYYYFDIS
ncbi:MAG: hypothetical protein ISS28_08390 [Candidatus Cloacimonetes bacterium]|nr:hypothetical protein [Candidatus Cloacimonadota bacterium]